jgi:Fur family ferric uptake transcriptional regulator
MTVSPVVPPLAFDDLAGLRISTARRLVLEALFVADGPVSAVHLARQLQLEESSVYRNLEVLEQHGLIRHLHLGHSPGLYVLVVDHDVEYLYCERCAKVTAVSPDRLQPVRDQIRQEFGYSVRFAHFAIVGLCAQCAASTDVPKPPAAGHAHAEASGPQDSHRTSRPSDDHDRTADHAHLHSHGDHVHSHPHQHSDPGSQQH